MEHFRRRSSVKSPSRIGRAVSGALRRLSPARREGTKIDEDADPEEDIKGPLGLNLLHNVTEPLIDFIFVHGLGGGSRRTWSFSPDRCHYWPKEWLSRDPDFRCARIHSFGYKADWGERRESVLNIHDFARSLLSEIHCNPDIRRSKTKIVLVAHSMGGIVIKKAYTLAREDPDLKDLASRIHTLYFLATPHRGSDLAKTLTNILKVSYGAKPFVTELERNSESIASINDSFRHFAEDLQLWSFYETFPSNLMLTKAIIVDKASAILGYPNERSSLLNADHRGVCKFDQQTDRNYQTLRNAFITTIDTILSEVSHAMSETSKMQHHRLVELTGVAEPPVDELSALEDIRATGSCEWLTSKEVYDSWRTAQPGSRPIFWLTGNAGAGKSILCSHVTNDLQEHELRCSYFFFKHGNATKSTIVGCLRALAYQMARSDKAILRRLLEVQQDAPLWEQWDEKTIWRKLFVGCVFKEPSPCLQFWVIDALDECRGFPAFLTLVAQLPSHMRIFLTSRSTPEIEKGLAKLVHLTEHYQIQNEDTLGDLSIFIGSRMDRLPASDDKGREKLKKKILAKASGSFLWVSLVVKELEQTYSEEGAEEVLNELPTDMNMVYARMLESILKNKRAEILARSVFMWTLLSLRPLKVNELHYAIRLDINQTVHNLAKSISAICGQLIFVNQKNEVETIHQTAMVYLLQQEAYADLALNKQQCHTRIAEMCLKILAGDFFKGLKPRSMKTVTSALTLGAEFADYACEYFSDHLQQCSSGDSTTWDLLCKFLDSNILSWIEYLARKRNLRSITRTAKNLRVYLMRRVNYLSPFSPQKESLEAWINDLIRLSAKFGTSLNISPSSIHTLIPEMCPPDSIIARTYASRQPALLIKGLIDRTWDNCLARIDYPAHQTCAVAHGEQYSAVAISDGAIFLYYQNSTQAKHILDHGERATILVFSNEDRYLASSGLRKVKVWDPAEGTQVWTFDTNDQALTLLFVNDNSALAAATQGNYMVTWDLQEGVETERWQWTDSIHETASQQSPRQQPGKASISPSYTVFAVSYRGLPIYLFDMKTEKFIGCCSRETNIHSRTASHYFVDALAFNPSPEINILVASYGDGELVIYDVESTELRYRSLDVYAHSLACSPDGRTLVTGSSRGTIQIFEFAGAKGETLSLMYQINAYEEGIRGIAFSSDNLRFSDIRGSQYRIWEPAVLACNDLGEGSQSDLSQAIPLEPKSVGMLEGPPEAEITTICCHPSGDLVFCGKRDGSVAYFETHTATQNGVLYRHAVNIGITCIAYTEKRSLLITADESGRVLINGVIVSQAGCEVVALVAEIRSEKSLTALLPNASGTRILIQGKRSAEVWTTEGEKVGFSIPFDNDDDRTIINHPLHAEHFMSIDRNDVRIYSWADALETQLSADRKLNALSVTITPPSPVHQRGLQHEDWSDLYADQQSSHFIVNILKGSPSSTPCAASAVLRVWAASSVSVSTPFPQPIPIPSFDNHAHRVRQIIGVTGSLILFLDTDLWVCSLNVTRATSFAHGAKRHFFLLSEWQSSDKHFIIEYVPTTREFLVARKHGVLVVSRGLEFKEPWLAS
ncbi:hypothetical protein K432DRAFT_429827 [Lepidopterella palustris CBS 459.81]|uniref:GPI inositol-deacylase n=1 Tax=Lepidopterella palustris CBS 459.81 TaxID=1314670 RepID=A0A8E2DZU1_9PEZI|nr:hypothetical protein K432DRAFT_429827 [Lepidopterella palustris CBS 459.81]